MFNSKPVEIIFLDFDGCNITKRNRSSCGGSLCKKNFSHNGKLFPFGKQNILVINTYLTLANYVKRFRYGTFFNKNWALRKIFHFPLGKHPPHYRPIKVKKK